MTTWNKVFELGKKQLNSIKNCGLYLHTLNPLYYTRTACILKNKLTNSYVKLCSWLAVKQ